MLQNRLPVNCFPVGKLLRTQRQKAERLKRYGTVSHELDKILDLRLNIIIDLITDIEHLLLGVPK